MSDSRASAPRRRVRHGAVAATVVTGTVAAKVSPALAPVFRAGVALAPPWPLLCSWLATLAAAVIVLALVFARAAAAP